MQKDELQVGRGLTMAAADRDGVRPPASIGATKIEVELECPAGCGPVMACVHEAASWPLAVVVSLLEGAACDAHCRCRHQAFLGRVDDERK